MISRLATIVRLIIIVTAVPLILITTNVRCVVNWPVLYSYGFEKYDIDEVTGIESDQLQAAGEQIRSYFGDDSEFITVKVKRYGEVIPNIYSDREVLHMKDVKNLLGLVYFLQIIAVVVVAIGILMGFATKERASLARSIRWVCRGGGVTSTPYSTFTAGISNEKVTWGDQNHQLPQDHCQSIVLSVSATRPFSPLG